MASGDDIESRCPLGYLNRVNELRNANDDSMAWLDSLGFHRGGCEEDLRRRQMRVAFEKMMLDRP
jgi:hypothetical protein